LLNLGYNPLFSPSFFLVNHIPCNLRMWLSRKNILFMTGVF
jgi:hypothetical protein